MADLREVALARHDLGFQEFNQMGDALGNLSTSCAASPSFQDILTFEIGLLEKFVITSDVVRDWREYVGQLLSDINKVMPAHVLFSIFKIDDELFDLEIFWRAVFHGDWRDDGDAHPPGAGRATTSPTSRRWPSTTIVDPRCPK